MTEKLFGISTQTDGEPGAKTGVEGTFPRLEIGNCTGELEFEHPDTTTCKLQEDAAVAPLVTFTTLVAVTGEERFQPWHPAPVIVQE